MTVQRKIWLEKLVEVQDFKTSVESLKSDNKAANETIKSNEMEIVR